MQVRAPQAALPPARAHSAPLAGTAAALSPHAVPLARGAGHLSKPGLEASRKPLGNERFPSLINNTEIIAAGAPASEQGQDGQVAEGKLQ